MWPSSPRKERSPSPAVGSRTATQPHVTWSHGGDLSGSEYNGEAAFGDSLSAAAFSEAGEAEGLAVESEPQTSTGLAGWIGNNPWSGKGEDVEGEVDEEWKGRSEEEWTSHGQE